MRLLLFNLATDADDPILGFTSRWISALARRVDSIHVITMRAGRVDLPANVHVRSAGLEKNLSRPRRVALFWTHLAHVLTETSIDVAFSHMAPIFTVLGAPLLRFRGVPVVTWYAHRQLTGTLRLAHHLSDKMVSVNASSYPYRQDKLVAVGHGIDTTVFAPGGTRQPGRPILLSVGRLSPIKHVHTLLEAVARLRAREQNVACVLVGDAPKRDVEYAERLRRDVRTMGLEEHVEFTGALAREAVSHWYRRCFAHVNCAPADNALDKAVLEAMASAKPSLSSAQGFAETMGPLTDRLLFRAGDAEDLADKLAALLALPEAAVADIGSDLRQRVVQLHDVEGVADRLMAVFDDVMTARQTGIHR